jgi:hypothetical protein
MLLGWGLLGKRQAMRWLLNEMRVLPLLGRHALWRLHHLLGMLLLGWHLLRHRFLQY